jgi:hypothetical protein
MLASVSLVGGSNFIRFGSVEVIMAGWVPVSVNWDTSKELSRTYIAQNTFTSVSMVSSLSLRSGSNFSRICSVEMVRVSSMPVTVDRYKSVVMMSKDMESNTFTFVTMVSSSTMDSGSNFSSIRSVKVIFSFILPVSENRVYMMISRISISEDTFTFVTVVSNVTSLIGSNFSMINGVKVIFNIILPISVNWN